jgi:hypothetical protein
MRCILRVHSSRWITTDAPGTRKKMLLSERTKLEGDSLPVDVENEKTSEIQVSDMALGQFIAQD